MLQLLLELSAEDSGWCQIKNLTVNRNQSCCCWMLQFRTAVQMLLKYGKEIHMAISCQQNEKPRVLLEKGISPTMRYSNTRR